MSRKASENTIDDTGFFTPGKGVNHMMISLFIWGVTGIIYKISTLFYLCAKYELICFISSLTLSIISGFIINRKLLKKQDFSKKLIYGTANILLLYTSSNGMQAAYCVASQPGENETKNCASIIPFIEARPWLPALYHISIIQDLRRENEILKRGLTDSKLGKTEGESTLPDEISALKNENNSLRDQIDSIRLVYRTLGSLDNNNQNNSDNSLLYDQIDTLQKRIKAFNLHQSDWNRLANIKHINTVKEIVTSATHDAGFYNFLFNTPINETLFMSRPE